MELAVRDKEKIGLRTGKQMSWAQLKMGLIQYIVNEDIVECIKILALPQAYQQHGQRVGPHVPSSRKHICTLRVHHFTR